MLSRSRRGENSALRLCNELAYLSEINHNMILKIYQKHFKQILDISKGMRI